MRLLFLTGAAAIALSATAASAQPISLRDSFPIGSATSLVCAAQSSSLDKAFGDIFDRGYQIVCRDASAPVAKLYALRRRGGDPAARLAALREEKAQCGAPAAAQLEGLGAVTRTDCTLRGSEVGYRVYLYRRGNSVYAAEGLTGYDSALQLGLRSLVADRPVPGRSRSPRPEPATPSPLPGPRPARSIRGAR
jgi:hypothetical protein